MQIRNIHNPRYSFFLGWISLQGLEGVKFPDSLSILSFGDDFDQALQHVCFPCNLEELTFGEGFHQSWEEVGVA